MLLLNCILSTFTWMFTTTKYGFSLWQGETWLIAHMWNYFGDFILWAHYGTIECHIIKCYTLQSIAHIFNIEMMKPQNLLLMCHEAKLTMIGKTIFCCSGGWCLRNEDHQTKSSYIFITQSIVISLPILFYVT